MVTLGRREVPRCAVPSCYGVNPKLYDERLEVYFCDFDCLAEYIAENPEETAEWYASLNVHTIDYD